VTARGEATRQKLLEAAELEFGEKGYYAASVSSITRRAGVAQGTFYLYFPSKEAILRELVRHMGQELRRTLTAATRGLSSRLEMEKAGFMAFLRFCLHKENLYKIVMQSQFIDESIYREYYQTLADAYTRGLARAQAKGEVRQGDPSAQAWALMGIAHFLGLRYAIWEHRLPPPDVLASVFDFIAAGLSPEPKGA
jgi:AcrR family transcriptional regulator